MTIKVNFRGKYRFISDAFPGQVSGRIRLVEEPEEWQRSTSRASSASSASAIPSSVKMVVRNTFLELEEDVNHKPPMRSESQGGQRVQ